MSVLPCVPSFKLFEFPNLFFLMEVSFKPFPRKKTKQGCEESLSTNKFNDMMTKKRKNKTHKLQYSIIIHQHTKRDLISIHKDDSNHDHVEAKRIIQCRSHHSVNMKINSQLIDVADPYLS